MIVTSLFSVYYGSLFDDADNAESLELAEGARFHDLYFVSEGAFAFFVMAMNYRLAADFFAVKGMRNLVEICEFMLFSPESDVTTPTMVLRDCLDFSDIF